MVKRKFFKGVCNFFKIQKGTEEYGVLFDLLADHDKIEFRGRTIERKFQNFKHHHFEIY